MGKRIHIQDSQSPRERLSQQQFDLLRSATPHEGRLFIPAPEAAGSLARRSAAALIKRGFLVETLAKGSEPLWRVNERGRAVSLRVTAKLAARSVDEGAAAASVENAPGLAVAEARVAEPDVRLDSIDGKPVTKRTLVIGLLERPQGANLADLVAATGWLPHTARAALTGLRHKGFVLDKSQGPDGRSCYRIAAAASHAARAV